MLDVRACASACLHVYRSRSATPNKEPACMYEYVHTCIRAYTPVLIYWTTQITRRINCVRLLRSVLTHAILSKLTCARLNEDTCFDNNGMRHKHTNGRSRGQKRSLYSVNEHV